MPQEPCEKRAKTVIVVGAGAAGLQAANLLMQSDAFLDGHIEVIILEARDRAGGRIHIDKRWGIPIDNGPNWIHGTLVNPVLPFAKISDTSLTYPDEARRTIYASSGKALHPDVSRFLYERIWKYADEAIELSANPRENIPPEWSMYDFCLAKISSDNNLDLEAKVIALKLLDLLTIFTAVDVRRQSLRHYQVEKQLPGDCPFVASTYGGILEHLARPSETAGILHLSHPVTRISVNADHISVDTPTTVFLADAVILTSPLGCLQHSTISFNPCLPARVQSAIANLGFGNLEKLFLKFERSWWVIETPLEPPETFTFLPPLTLPETAPNQALTIFSLASMPAHAQPVLVVYLAGDWPTYLKTFSHAEIADLFQKHYIPLLPNYTESCTIIDLYCTNWTSDPFSYGCYTHVPVGSLEGVEDLRILGEKIMSLSDGDGGLWFAGEHAGTADLATVNGAMTSGESAAINVLKTFGLEVPQTDF